MKTKWPGGKRPQLNPSSSTTAARGGYKTQPNLLADTSGNVDGNAYQPTLEQPDPARGQYANGDWRAMMSAEQFVPGGALYGRYSQGNQPMPAMPYTNYSNVGATPMAGGRPVKPQQRPSQYQMPGAGAPPIQQTYVGQGNQLWNHPNPVQKPPRPAGEFQQYTAGFNRPMQGSNPGTPQYLPHQIGGMNVGRPGVRPANTQVGGGGAGVGMGPAPAPPTVAPSNTDGSFSNSYGNPQNQAAMGAPNGFDLMGQQGGGMPQGFFPTLGQAYQNAGSLGSPNLQALTQNFPGFGQMLNGMSPSGSRSTTSTQRMPSQSMYRVRRQSYSF